jgi:SAM-dependent methyltransferase
MNNVNKAFSSRYFGEPSKVDHDQEYYLKRMPRYRKRHLFSFIMSIPKNGSVLDLGCGKGKTVRLIQAFRPDVRIVAVDITDMKAYLPDTVTFIQASSDTIMGVLPPQSFDAIVSEHVIEHIVYPNSYFESCFTLLKDGGRVFIETPNWTRLFLPFSPLYFWNDYTHIHPYSRTALRRAFVEYGFREEYVVSVSSVDFGARFLKTRIEGGSIKTGHALEGVVYTPKETLRAKVWHAILDLGMHPFARDILIGVAERPRKS